MLRRIIIIGLLAVWIVMSLALAGCATEESVAAEVNTSTEAPALDAHGDSMPEAIFTPDAPSEKITYDENDYVVISAGSNHAMAIKGDGSLWAWAKTGVAK